MTQVVNYSHLAGRHIIVDAFGCNAQLLTNQQALHDILVAGVVKTSATIISDKYHKFGEQCGVTGILILAESHCSIHTWPEHNLATIDIYMCGDNNPLLAGEEIIKRLQPTHYKIIEISRGKGAFNYVSDYNNHKIIHETIN